MEQRPMDTVAIGAVSRIMETIGLSMVMTW